MQFLAPFVLFEAGAPTPGIPLSPSRPSADSARRGIRDRFGAPPSGLSPRPRRLPKTDEARLYPEALETSCRRLRGHFRATLPCGAVPFDALPTVAGDSGLSASATPANGSRRSPARKGGYEHCRFISLPNFGSYGYSLRNSGSFSDEDIFNPCDTSLFCCFSVFHHIYLNHYREYDFTCLDNFQMTFVEFQRFLWEIAADSSARTRGAGL